MKFSIKIFHRNSVDKIPVSSKVWQEYRTLREELCSFTTWLTEFFLEWEMFQKKFVEKIKTHILCSVTFFFPENRTICEIMWGDNVNPDRTQMKIRSMRFACWINRARDTNSEYVKIIIAFPLQLWLQERASMLLYNVHRLSWCIWFSLRVDPPRDLPTIILCASCTCFGGRGGTVVKVLCYKSEGRWFDSRWCHWNFLLT